MHKFKRPNQYANIVIEPATVFYDCLPGLKEYKDGWAWACCPFHEDRSPSFCVNLETGSYRCHSSSCGESGSNLISFFMALHQINYREARQFLEERYA